MREPREIGRDIVGDAVGEILLLGVIAENGERQHDNRQARKRRETGSVRRAARHLWDKAIAASRHRLDAAAFGSLMVQNPAKGGDRSGYCPRQRLPATPHS
jgi:hypothetical protein